MYHDWGILASVTDSETGRKNTYLYDTTGRLMKYEEKGSQHRLSLTYGYDNLNQVNSIVEVNNGINRSTTYTYDDAGRVTKSQTEDASRNYTYDGFGRIHQTLTKAGDSQIKSDTYSYTGSTTGSSGQVSQHVISAAGYNKTYTYGYDDNGNIVSISDGTNTTTYEYDTANQLIRENNQAGGYTCVWNYDNAGNILSKKEYSYTTGEVGEVTNQDTYSYGNSEWGDLLTSYNGTSYTYDEVGNLLVDEEYDYTWRHGRELQYISAMFEYWRMTYDVNGLRTKRESNVWTYDYVYSAGQLSSMKIWNSSKGKRWNLYFTYDANGTPMTVKYNGTLYYYVTNLQGDVIAILNSSGNSVVEYSYDAWGNVLSVSGSHASTIGEDNPLRYRGYVYDKETKLYYLESRYYNPAYGRFINADAYAATGQGFVGNNMFAYCLNNPVNMMDENGNLAKAARHAENGTSNRVKDIGVAVVDEILEELADDALNYNVNNQSEEIVLQSKYFSAYKGRFVIRTPFDRCGSYGILFITHETNTRTNPEDYIRHEYGHTVQLQRLGFLKYTVCIGIPSLLQWGNGAYYSKPFEITADVFGNVQSRVHTKNDIEAGFYYLEYSKKRGIHAWGLIK